MELYQQRTNQQANSKTFKERESIQFDAFKDQQFVKKKREESQMIRNGQKGIGSLNVLAVTHLKQDVNSKKGYSALTHEKYNSKEAQNTHRQLKLEQVKEERGQFILKQTIEKQNKPNPKAQRYTRASQSQIKVSKNTEIQDNENKQTGQKINLLKKILQHYNNRSLHDSFESNLINKVNFNYNSSLSCQNKLMAINKLPSKSGARKDASASFTSNPKNKLRHKTKSNIKGTDFFEAYFDQSNILVQAQGLNDLIKSKQEDRRKVNKSVNERELIREKYQRKVIFYPNSTKKASSKYETLPTEKIKTFDNSNIQTSINLKVNKFKEFLFLINFSNKIYRELDFIKYDSAFKVYIGKGNNSNLIKAIMKRRFWFESTKKIEEAHFVWTQLKEESVYDRQNMKFDQKIKSKVMKNTQKQNIFEKQVKIETLEQEITETRHTMSEQINIEEEIQVKNITLDSSERRDNKDVKSRKIKDRNMSTYQPESRILTHQQYISQKQIMNQVFHRKKPLFNDRINYLKNFNITQVPQLKEENIHNHLPANGLLGNKKAMFYMLRQYYKLTGRDIFSIVPETYHIKKGLIDDQYKQFMSKFVQNRLSAHPNYWIIKPGQFSNRGQGISCSNKLEEIKGRINKLKGKKNRSLIIQRYMTNPLLYNGRKFDIRTYMLLTVNNRKLRGYWYHEGYIRTSSYQWSLQEISDNQIHLTNDAIQKYANSYGKYEPGNKLTYSQLQRYLDSLPKVSNTKSCNFLNDIYPKIKDIAADAIKSSFCFIDPERKGNNFQIFGFDFMIDNEFKPWLIEINTNPCLEMNCPVLNRIVPSLVENAFRIGLDSIIPPPLNYSSTHKYSIPENALHYNKFQLIFDEDRDGPVFVQLYKDSKIVNMIDEYEEDKQIYEQEGQEITLDEL